MDSEHGDTDNLCRGPPANFHPQLPAVKTTRHRTGGLTLTSNLRQRLATEGKNKTRKY